MDWAFIGIRTNPKDLWACCHYKKVPAEAPALYDWCGEAEETNWHVHAECKHAAVVAQRRRSVAAIHEVVQALPVSGLAKKLLGMPWALNAEHCIAERESEDDMTDLLSQWAPELAAAAGAIFLRPPSCD